MPRQGLSESFLRLFLSSWLSPSVVRGGLKQPERPKETVIIKSCNQLANLSSSVLIKPSPVISPLFSFSFFHSRAFAFPFFSCRDLRTRSYSYIPFRTSSFRLLSLIFFFSYFRRVIFYFYVKLFSIDIHRVSISRTRLQWSDNFGSLLRFDNKRLIFL